MPAGSFMAGRHIDLPNRVNKTPLHKVTIPKAFAVGKYEMAFDQKGLCGKEGCCSYSPDHIG